MKRLAALLLAVGAAACWSSDIIIDPTSSSIAATYALTSQSRSTTALPDTYIFIQLATDSITFDDAGQWTRTYTGIEGNASGTHPTFGANSGTYTRLGRQITMRTAAGGPFAVVFFDGEGLDRHDPYFNFRYRRL